MNKETINQEVLDAAAQVMDNEIREDMSSYYEPGFDNPSEFLAEYKRRHAEKFGEEFTF